MNTLLHDLRYGLRMLLKHKGFTVVAIIALALGIGANTAIFSLVNGVLLRPLPFRDADRIVYFEGHNPSEGITDSNISVLDFQDWSARSTAFSGAAFFWSGGAALAAQGGAEAERVPRVGVSPQFFEVLGVQPMLGRTFLAEENAPDAAPVAILSEGLWKRRFGSDRDIVGKSITINARPVTVVGVLAGGFEFPENTQVWSPAGVNPAEETRSNRSYSAIARLKPGVELEQAQTQIDAINAQLRQSFHESNKGWEAQLALLHERLVRSVRPSLLLLLGAVGCVLLIACANVANLLLARAAAREKEVAIRAALGASRGRVLRQMLTESMLLSVIGGALGLILSFWLVELLVAISPPNSPRFDQATLDARVLLFTLALATLTGLIFGLAPALKASKLDLSGSLKEGGRGETAYRRTNARSLLLIGEVALSLILLVGAGLLIQSFLRLQEVKPGFNPEHVLIASLSLPGARYKEDQERIDFYQRLMERLQTIPGVQAAGAGVNLPLGASDYGIGKGFVPEGRPLGRDGSSDSSWSTITPAYFEALQIPLLTGRAFNERDQKDAPKTVIVNRALAQRHFGSATAAIGKRLTIWPDEEFAREIVGVVGDTKTGTLETESGAQIYTPHAQDGSWGFMALTIRTAGEPAAMTAAVRREVAAVDKDLPLFNVRTMEDVVAVSVGTRRVSMQLFTVFAGAALLLAAVGIYGVMAYNVTQRTQEIGIRMALGAQKSDVLRMVVRQGMTLTIIGIAAGLAGAFVLTRLIANLLFGVGANDPSTFVAIALLLIFVSFLACYLPARRAANLDPMKALARG